MIRDCRQRKNRLSAKADRVDADRVDADRKGSISCLLDRVLYFLLVPVFKRFSVRFSPRLLIAAGVKKRGCDVEYRRELDQNN